MKWERTEAQVAQYVEFWNSKFEGRMPMDFYCNILKAQHNKHKLLLEYAISFDRDKDGFISKEEFNFGLQTLLVHDPTIENVTYETMLKEADKNQDGKISIEELVQWLRKHNQ